MKHVESSQLDSVLSLHGGGLAALHGYQGLIFIEYYW